MSRDVASSEPFEVTLDISHRPNIWFFVKNSCFLFFDSPIESPLGSPCCYPTLVGMCFPSNGVTMPLSVCPKGFSESLFASFGPQFAAPGVAFLAYLSETILYCGTSCRAGYREGAYNYVAHPPFPLPCIDAPRLHAGATVFLFMNRT